MLDEDLRDIERELRASPRDQALALRYLQALRRSGSLAPDAAPGQIEPWPNPGVAKADLIIIARRAYPRPGFAWLDAMDRLVGTVAQIRRVARDNLSVVIEGESLVPDSRVVLGRSFGFASLVRVP